VRVGYGPLSQGVDLGSLRFRELLSHDGRYFIVAERIDGRVELAALSLSSTHAWRGPYSGRVVRRLADVALSSLTP